MIEYSAHALVRAQQRAVPPAVVTWLLDFGSVTRHRGADVYAFDKRARRMLERYLGARAYRRIEDLLDVYAVISDEGEIITVAKRQHRLRR